MKDTFFYISVKNAIESLLLDNTKIDKTVFQPSETYGFLNKLNGNTNAKKYSTIVESIMRTKISYVTNICTGNTSYVDINDSYIGVLINSAKCPLLSQILNKYNINVTEISVNSKVKQYIPSFARRYISSLEVYNFYKVELFDSNFYFKVTAILSSYINEIIDITIVEPIGEVTVTIFE